MSEALDKIAGLWEGTADDLFSEIICDYKKSDEVIVVAIRTGKNLSFRPMNDRTEFVRIGKQVKKFCQVKATVKPEDKELLDVDDETKGWAVILSEMAIKPKLPVLSLLKLAKHAWPEFEVIKDGYTRGLLAEKARTEQDGVDAAGEESSETLDGATS